MRTNSGKPTRSARPSTSTTVEDVLKPNLCSKVLAECLRQEQMTTTHTVARARRKFRWQGSVARLCNIVDANISVDHPLAKDKVFCSTNWCDPRNENAHYCRKKLADVPSISTIDDLARCFIQMWFFKYRPHTGVFQHNLFSWTYQAVLYCTFSNLRN